jgi:hypothetical protein
MRNSITNARLIRAMLTAVSLSAILYPVGSFAAGPDMAMQGMSKDTMKGSAIAGTTAGYSFELVGQPKSSGGKSTVSVRIIHTADNKPVIGAIVIQSRADMGPINMAAMTAPIKALPATTPGIYTFEVANGPVWNKPDKWELSFSAKVQGEAQTVHGAVVVTLSP